MTDGLPWNREMFPEDLDALDARHRAESTSPPYSRVMSVQVDLDKLAEVLADFTFAYLITVSDDHRAHTVAVDPVLAGGIFDVGPVGRTTFRNLADRDGVTLLWPPRASRGYTLIVDGRGLISGDDAPLQIVPSHAVLHRKSTPGTATKPGCKDDCVPLDG